MGEIGSGKYRIKSKMVHLDLLRGIKETAIMLDSSERILKSGHENKNLPFPSILIEGAYLFYLPISMLKSIKKVQDLGVTKVIPFLKYIFDNKLDRFLERDYDWEGYDLEKWK